MARPKKKPLYKPAVAYIETVEVTEEIPPFHQVTHTPIYPLTIDYPNEGLNDIARKINQIIEHLNEK